MSNNSDCYDDLNIFHLCQGDVKLHNHLEHVDELAVSIHVLLLTEKQFPIFASERQRAVTLSNRGKGGSELFCVLNVCEDEEHV